MKSKESDRKPGGSREPDRSFEPFDPAPPAVTLLPLPRVKSLFRLAMELKNLVRADRIFAAEQKADRKRTDNATHSASQSSKGADGL
jgi:hypothetical protein